MHKYDFTEPKCTSCEHHKGTNCYGFKKRRNPKRFSSRDPREKAPKWCPRRLDPTVIRVYRFKDEMATHFGLENLLINDKIESAYECPFEHHYALAFEHPYGATAEAFYESTQTEGVGDVYGFELQYGDVVEVDSGLVTVPFLYRSRHNFKPARFDSAKVEREIV